MFSGTEDNIETMQRNIKNAVSFEASLAAWMHMEHTSWQIMKER